MAFRDDTEAARARADALERENRELRQRLAEGRSEPARVQRSPRRAAWLLIAAGIAVLVLGALLAGVLRLPPNVVLVATVVLAAMLTGLGLATRQVHIAGPNELLVILGRRRVLPDGQVVGYRVVHGGSVLVLPVLERVERLSLEPIALTLELGHLRTSDLSLLGLQLGAAVKISAGPSLRDLAIERFLGQDRAEIGRVARELLERAVSSFVAGHTLDELRGAPDGVTEATIAERVGEELGKLGLMLDRLRLERVQAERG